MVGIEPTTNNKIYIYERELLTEIHCFYPFITPLSYKYSFFFFLVLGGIEPPKNFKFFFGILEKNIYYIVFFFFEINKIINDNIS